MAAHSNTTVLVCLLASFLLSCTALERSATGPSLKRSLSSRYDRRSLADHKIRGQTHTATGSANTTNAQAANTTDGSALINLRAAYLVPHNILRLSLGLRPLVWNQSITYMAQDWANYLATANDCGLQHGDYYLPNSDDTVGQNLAMFGSNEKPLQPPGVGVKMWVDEGQDYFLAPFPKGCVTRECGHFTQMVWRDTTSVGCASADCHSRGMLSRVWVCNYYPAGNIIGEMPY